METSEDLHKRIRLLEDQINRYQDLLERTSDWIWEMTPEGIFTYVSPRVKDLLGYDAEELLGTDAFLLMSTEEAEKVGEEFYFYVQNAQPFRNLININRHKDGYNVIIESSGVPIFDENGLLVAYRGVDRNITERFEEAEELKIAKKKAQEADLLKTAFLANMSHEIRTPLNGIVGFAEMLNDSDLTENEKKQYINIIKDSSDQLLSIISDIIDIAKIEADQININYGLFSLKSFMEDLYLLFENRVNRSGKRTLDFIFQYQLDKDLRVETDKRRLTQILSNLLGNAFKFTTKGEVVLTCRKNPDKTDMIDLIVSDTGCGIPESVGDSIFTRFTQFHATDEARAQPGTGLGLSIVKGLADMLNADISYSSREGVGTEFVFSLPMNPPRLKSNALHHDNVPGEHRLAGLNILIIEDDSVGFQYLRMILSKEGASVLWSSNGSDGIEAVLKLSEIDAVLLDIKLPDISGWDVLKQIKKIRGDLPVIAQTAYPQEYSEKNVASSLFDGYLTKPIQKFPLFAALKSCLKP